MLGSEIIIIKKECLLASQSYCADTTTVIWIIRKDGGRSEWHEIGKGGRSLGTDVT